ncbi:hypothetical protein LX36DRAFT_659321 [Colletotrichum falcatum]|nr:hypothetical protein LX36DRAFT_659321 [Colletotrichum falcatum]
MQQPRQQCRATSALTVISQRTYSPIKKTPCCKCNGRYSGRILTPTVKECTNSNSNGGDKKSDPAKACTECLGTGRKVTPCGRPGCINGNMKSRCKGDIHKSRMLEVDTQQLKDKRLRLEFQLSVLHDRSSQLSMLQLEIG